MVTVNTQLGVIESAHRVRVEKTTQTGGFIDANNVQDALEDLDDAVHALAASMRVVTAAGGVTVSSTEGGVAINKTVGAATQVTLPPAASRNGLPVVVKDMKGDANTNNITVVPDAADTLGIDGNAQDILNNNKASRGYRPIAGGWLRT